MARRRVAYRKRQQNRFSMFLVSLVVLMIMVVVFVKNIELREQIELRNIEITELQSQKEAQEIRAQEIEEYRTYTQTKRYVEEVAKEKLGLVYEGEIVFKEKD